MANGHVEIHDPISNHSDLNTNSDCERQSTSDKDGMEDTVEFRLLMAYAKRRRPNKDADLAAQMGPHSPAAPAKTEKEVKGEEKKRKRRKKRKTGIKGKNLLKFLSCISPKTKDDDTLQTDQPISDPEDRCFRVSDDVREEDKLDEAASQLTKIADDVPFTPPEIESDSKEDAEVEKVIGLLLREAGDKLNDEELNGAAIAKELFWDYGFFEKLIKALLTRMGLMPTDSLGPQASPKTQIAVTCEVTSRLSALETLPMSRMLAHGAKYLQIYHSSWVKQQGGYENVFHSDDEDDDVQ
ncbi:uncharacterized protein ABDE67_021609 [Symphorus nematophorus]